MAIDQACPVPPLLLLLLLLLQEVSGRLQSMCSVGQHMWVGFGNGMLSVLDAGGWGGGRSVLVMLGKRGCKDKWCLLP